MKIKRVERKQKKILFKDLKNGDVFVYEHWDGIQHVCIKIASVTTIDNIMSSYVCNAVYLEDGTCRYMNSDKEVIKVKAKLIYS